MNDKFSNKSSNFFKKEGFYVILFVCLCIVATVAVFSTKAVKQVKVQQPDTQNEVALEENINSSKLLETPAVQQPENALQVKKNTDTKVDSQKSSQTEVAAAKTSNATPAKDNSAAVSKAVDTSFAKPVDGKMARAYTEDPVFWDSTATFRPNFGMDIQADLGKPVIAVMDGRIEEINTDTQDGVQIVINHQNGLKSVYSNLDSKVSVTKGQAIRKGDTIGKIGKTTIRAAYEKYGSHLHFAMLSGKDYIDPAKYIKY